MGYLKSEAEIRPKGNFFVVDTEYVGHNGSDLKSIISAIQTAESSASTAISGLDTRITANTTSISGLDTRVTALEESGGGGSGGTTNYNELSNIPQINGVSLKGNLDAQNLGLANAVDIPTPMVSYGTCSTAAATAEKVVTLVNADGWTLKTGCIIAIRHANTNSANNPTLNVNGSGAKPIMYNTSTITTSNLSYAGAAMRQTVYCYNGTSWAWISHGIDNNTTYSNRSAASGGIATSLVTTGEKYTWNNKYDKPNDGIPKADLASDVQTSLGKADTALQSYTEKYTGTYSKPSGGIPKTDLASAVQTSLGLADTALQSYTEKYTGTYSKPSGGIPKTDLASAVQTSLGKADTALQSYTEKYTGTYSKPSGGIPKSDLASAVQTSLGKADTALQSHQSLSGYLKESNGALIAYGTSTTAAATAEKVVTLIDADDWALRTGCVICVKHTNTNTAQNPTLNVNGSGAKSIIYGSGAITTVSLSYAGEATRQTSYFYNGTSWVWMSHNVDNNTTYSSKAAESGGTATSLVTTGEKYTWNAKTSNTGTVTSVSVKMNGATKGTVTTSGTIDLGTVITSHQSLDACAKTADLGDSAYKSVKNLSAKSHTGWSNYDTDSGIVPTMSFMAYWNGAYASSGSSNLSYCNKGAFGTIVTKATGDYVSSTVTSVAITDFLTTNTGYTVARSRIRKQGSQYSGWVEISGTFKANTAHIVGTTKVGSGYLYLGGCYMSDEEWSVKNIAYCCINGTGNITVGGSGSAGGTRIYIPINFII